MTEAVLTITLFDFTDPENPKKITGQLPYDPNEAFAPVGPPLKVSIGTGDAFANAVVTLPVAALNALMSNIMMTWERERNSGLVGFEKPQVIVPN